MEIKISSHITLFFRLHEFTGGTKYPHLLTMLLKLHEIHFVRKAIQLSRKTRVACIMLSLFGVAKGNTTREEVSSKWQEDKQETIAWLSR